MLKLLIFIFNYRFWCCKKAYYVNSWKKQFNSNWYLNIIYNIISKNITLNWNNGVKGAIDPTPYLVQKRILDFREELQQKVEDLEEHVEKIEDVVESNPSPVTASIWVKIINIILKIFRWKS